MELVQYDTVSTVDMDELVLKHQGISSHSAEYTPMYFQLFMDWMVASSIWVRSIQLTLSPKAMQKCISDF